MLMARPLRITFPGAFYHVTSRGNESKAVFKENNGVASSFFTLPIWSVKNEDLPLLSFS